jgi:hypothetical protein
VIVPSAVLSTNTVGCTNIITQTWTANDGCGNSTNVSQVITVIDTTAPTATQGTIADCYTSVAAANAAALGATTALADACDASPTKLVQTSAVAGCSTPIVVRVSDACGNYIDLTYNTRVDNIAPVISSVTATQALQNVINCVSNVVQGTVTLQVTATDNCSFANGHPAVTLVNNVTNTATATCTATNGSTYTYVWNVTNTTADGTWTATVDASDYCSSTYSNFTLCVDKAQITGLIQLDSFVGTNRVVTFVATTNTTVLKTWVINVYFGPGNSTTNYTLTAVPALTTGISAKTDWNLREKLAVTLDINGQAVANFVADGVPGWSDATDHYLRGGDIDAAHNNQVSFLDYSVLGNNFFTANPVADINGDGVVNLFDYSILSVNWFKAGDPQ